MISENEKSVWKLSLNRRKTQRLTACLPLQSCQTTILHSSLASYSLWVKLIGVEVAEGSFSVIHKDMDALTPSGGLWSQYQDTQDLPSSLP